MQTLNQNEHPQFHGFWASINLLNQKQRKEIVHQLLSDLSSNDRAIISLFYFENLTENEISSVMSVPKEVVSSTIKSLIVSLRDIVQSSEQKVNTLLH